MLAGGDLDGDIYCLVKDTTLHPEPEMIHDPANYDPPELQRIDRPSTARDIAQFVVDFIKVRIWIHIDLHNSSNLH
jgi:RNA-dependent RNA polymerase